MSFGINQMNQLANKFSKMGWDETLVTMLGQANDQTFRIIEEILRGASPEEAAKKVILNRQVGTNTTHLRYVESITLSPTVGSVMLAEATDIFNGYICQSLKSWHTDNPGQDTSEVLVDIFEISKSANFRTLFGSLAINSRSLVLSQGQIIEFVRSYRKLLGQDGFVTSFLFQVGERLFVACIKVRDGRLEIRVFHFDYSEQWPARGYHRLVVPQQTT